MNHNVEKIHQASMRILARTGMQFHHPDAQKLLQDNGIRMEGDKAYFTEEQIMHWVKMAPNTFTLYADNPAHDMVIGGDVVQIGTSAGCPMISDKDGQKRSITTEDYLKALKLYEVNGDFHINGGLFMQPGDLPIHQSALLLTYISMLHSEKVLFLGGCGGYQQMEAQMAMMAAYFGGVASILDKPRMLAVVNMNTPLQLDCNMTESLFTFAKYGQPICITSAAMAGSTSPATLAGTLALVNCEVLAGIALTQMVRPGTPVCYGSQSTTADMACGSIAIGAPEGALCYRYGALLSKYYNLPCRIGGSLTDAKAVDVQAGYESMLTARVCFENKVNLILQSAGIMDGYNCFSFEKLMCDFEILGYLLRYQRDVVVDEETIPEDVIDKVAHDGKYLMEMHTCMHCRKEPYQPHLAVRGATEPAMLMQNVETHMEAMIQAYKKPQRNQEAMTAVRQILLDQNIDEAILTRIEALQ